MERVSGRKPDEIRNITITKNFIKNTEGSALIECGNTKVICTVTIAKHVPVWLKGSGKGWLTSEYGMLPACASARISRDKHLASGRTKEIQRLIGRTLRSVIDLECFGEKTIHIDCDVIQADGGTRTASINGAMTALFSAMIKLKECGDIEKSPINDIIGALSVGISDGEIITDLDYIEDCNAQVDMNVVMNSAGKFVEIQGTAEKNPFDAEQLKDLLSYAQKGISEIIAIQKEIFKNDLAWLINL